jgi:hypothetical protein
MLGRQWRWMLVFLGIQYLGEFWFVQTTWPFSLAIIKLITGIIACLSLASSQEGIESFSKPESSLPQGSLFKLFAASLVILTALATAPQMSTWMGINNFTGLGTSLLLIGLGLLQLGISIQPVRVIIALLTLLSGFEIMYAFIETSTLVAAMLVVINIGLALIGVFLLNKLQLEKSG